MARSPVSDFKMNWKSGFYSIQKNRYKILTNGQSSKNLHRTMVTCFSEASQVQTPGLQPDVESGLGEA